MQNSMQGPRKFNICQRCHHNLYGHHDFNDLGHDENQSKASTTANPIEADVKFKRMLKSIKAS